jgi:bifunctional DNase/RNase
LKRGFLLKYEYKPKARKDGGITSFGIVMMRIRRWLSRNTPAVIATIVLLSAAALIGYYMVPQLLSQDAGQQSSETPLIILPALFTSGYTKVDIDADYYEDQGVVTLTSGCKQIVADVEAYQAQSIMLGLEGMIGSRPNSHDLVVDTFRAYGIDVLMVKIDEVRNDTYYGRMMLRKGNDIETLSVRPSDATAIAVRVDAPVYMNSTILYEYGEDICGNNSSQ